MPGTEMAGSTPFAAYHDTVARHVEAAGAQWAQYLVGSATVTVQVQLYPQSSLPADSPQLLADTPTTLRDRTAVVGNENGQPIVEFAAAHRIRTGQPIDVSGAPDVTIRVGERYLKELLHFDADPFNRIGPVPSDKTEAFGRFVHELGHALGFNGFYRGDGTYDAVAMRSTFDRLTVIDSGGTSSFVGPLAMALYGGPVPLTTGARGHLGNDADPRLFGFSAQEVMNGRTAYEGMRYNVSELDVRMLCDIGVPCALTTSVANAAPSPSGQAQATPAPTLVPTSRVVEYYNAALGHYFVTSIPVEIAKLDDGAIAGWSRTGESFSAFPIGSGNVPVCRFFSASFAPRSSHFYSALANECDVVRSEHDWDYEGSVFEVRLPDGAGECAAPLVPLYRLYNNGEAGAPNHRYTTSQSVRATMIGRGWTPEGLGTLGVVACVAG